MDRSAEILVFHLAKFLAVEIVVDADGFRLFEGGHGGKVVESEGSGNPTFPLPENATGVRAYTLTPAL
jgi:hypothetical protein